VTEDRDMEELLRALGQVEPPVPAALEAAREVLWSAVAAEMLAADPAGGTARTRAAGTGRPQEDAWHRRGEPSS
jgi:hypothetical protein